MTSEGVLLDYIDIAKSKKIKDESTADSSKSSISTTGDVYDSSEYLKNIANTFNIDYESVLDDNNNNTSINDSASSTISSPLGTQIKITTNTRKKKYSEEQIEIIKSVIRDHKTSKKTMCNYLESEHNIKISVYTLNKITNGTY